MEPAVPQPDVIDAHADPSQTLARGIDIVPQEVESELAKHGHAMRGRKDLEQLVQGRVTCRAVAERPEPLALVAVPVCGV